MKPTFKVYTVPYLAAVVIAGLAAVAVPQSAQAAMIAVNCPGGGSELQDAIDAAASGDTIELSGLCEEGNVRVSGDKANLTIRGVEVGAGISSHHHRRNIIIHGHQIILKDLEFSGGRGTQVDGGSATFEGNKFFAGSSTGIAIHVTNSGVATILGNEIGGHQRGGILVTNNSMVYVGVTGGGPQVAVPNLLDGSGTAGTASAVKIRRTARGRVEGNCIRNWGQSGVRIDTHASAHVSGNVIADNDAGGISVTEVSLLTLTQDSAPNSIHNATNSHLLDGVILPNGDGFEPCAGFPASASDDTPNTGYGVVCENTSLVTARNGNEDALGGTLGTKDIGASCFVDF